MEIDDILNARHAAAADAQLRQQMNQAQMDNTSAFAMNTGPGPTLHRQQTIPPDQNMMSYPNLGQTPSNTQMMQNGLMNSQSQEDNTNQQTDGDGSRPTSEAPKAFACSTCAKGFARRSDLARHERIHSGVRPHQCDYPGCGKQFIQRSALTVHARVHTGEKPHMCERCGKPFSDSSSLARHRRIHSGKRPYKCPYANCQKTFTRRTTLTRHQHSHTGTIEQAAAETNAKLSNTGQHQQSQGQPEGDYSDAGSSAGSGQSPGQRPITISPTHQQSQMQNMQRHVPDFAYLSQNGSLPPHMRNDFQQSLPRQSPGLNVPQLAHYNNNSMHRPSTTSHPAGYGPPQPLEPPANTSGSGPASPHLGALSWGSPGTHGNLPSPPAMESFAYPDPSYGAGGHPLYYPGSNIRRPGSTEPDQYELRPRNHMGNNMGNHISHMNFMPNSAPIDWSHMPTHSSMKEERPVL